MSLYTRSLGSEESGIIRTLPVQIFRVRLNICVYKSRSADLVNFPASCREAQNRYIEIRMILGSFGACTLLESPSLFSSFFVRGLYLSPFRGSSFSNFSCKKGHLTWWTPVSAYTMMWIAISLSNKVKGNNKTSLIFLGYPATFNTVIYSTLEMSN